MSTWLLLLATYGMVFGVQHKMPFLLMWVSTGHPVWWKIGLRSLLNCPYCLGFWAGWLVWGLSTKTWALVNVGFVRAFASAAFCYALDVLLSWLEARSNEQLPENDGDTP